MAINYFSLASGNFLQDWANADLLSAGDDWANVPSIVGYRGDGLTATTGIDPRTVTGTSDVIDVNVDRNDPSVFNTGGVTEFDGIPDRVVALQGSGTARAPYLVIHLDTTGRQDVVFSTRLRDIDTASTSPQPVAIQYRVGATGDWLNIDGGYVANANVGVDTPLSVTLPAAANNQAQVQVRVITTDAVGSDAFIGVDDIAVMSNPVGGISPGVLSIADASVVEGDGGTAVLTLTVTRVGGSDGAVSATWTATLDGTASAMDVTGPLTGSVDFAVGETSKTFTVQVVGDTAIENDETFTIALSAPTGGAVLGDASAVATITNDDAAPAAAAAWINEVHYDNNGGDVGEFVEIAGVAGTSLAGWTVVLYNGNPGQRSAYSTVTLSGTIPDQSNGFGTLSVAYAANGIQNGGAGAAGEADAIALVDASGRVVEFISYEGSFVAASGPAAGMTSVNVGVFEDGQSAGTSIGRVGSGNEASDFTFALITDDTPGTINVGQAFGAGLPQVSIGDVTLAEGNAGQTAFVFTLTRTGPLSAFSVDYFTADGSATAGGDYAATSGTVSFAAGEATATVTVQVVGDVTPEIAETFTVGLRNPAGAEIVDGQATGTIATDDGLPPVVTISDVTADEGNAGTGSFTFTVTRTGGTGAFEVDFTTGGGNAAAMTDYLATSGRLSFAAGENAKTITVTVNGDTVAEPNESFNVTLSNATGDAVLSDAIAVGTIANDDVTLVSQVQGTSYFSPILAADGITAFNQASTTTVTIRAVVTALDDTGARQGFYITEERGDWDASDLTSEGIFVTTRNDANVGTALAAFAPDLRVGDLVTVTAQVMESQTFQNLPRTVLVNPTGVTVTASDQALPTLVLDASRPIPSGILTAVTPDYRDSADGAGDTFDASLYALSFFETIEGMLVTVPDMVVADGFVSTSGGQPFFKGYSTVHADAAQINDRGGYTIGGDPRLSMPDTATVEDDVLFGGRHLHDGDVNPDIFEVDFTDFAIDAPAALTGITMGDQLGDVTGILDFDFTDLKLYVTDIDPSQFVDTTPVLETTTLGADSRALTVATFNVENLDPGDGMARFEAIADAIATNLNGPDILLIEEIQDNNGAAQGGVTVNGVTLGASDASITFQMLVEALNARMPGSRYQWVDEAPIVNAEGGEPGGNIRVGFLYDTNRVQLGDLAADATLAERRQFTDRIGDGTRADGDRIAFSDDMLGAEINPADWSSTRRSLLGEFTFNGNTVYTTGNHFPAKGGSGQFWQLNQTLETGNPVNSGWAQRNAVAQDVYSVLNLIAQGNPQAGLVAGGDINEFQFYRALETLTGYTLADGTARTDGARFDNLTLTLAEGERYTYTFDGRSQAIDHVITDQRLSAVATYDVVHINTGGAPGALSDHDPAVASFDYRNFSEVLVGIAGIDTIDGAGGDDRITGLGGNDVLAGGGGRDTAVFGGNRADYALTLVGGEIVVRDLRGGSPDGTDRLRGFEVLAFGDGILTDFANGVPVAGADRFFFSEDATSDNLYDAVLANDTDTDQFGDTLSIVSVDTAGTLGTVRFDAGARTLVYVADGEAIGALGPNEAATDSFRYTVSDGQGGTSTATVTIDLVGALDAGFRIDGGEGSDTLTGGAGDDVLQGNGGDDVLTGGGGSDYLGGGAGNDTLNGGRGDDLLAGGAGGDVFVFTEVGGRDRLLDFVRGELIDLSAIDADVAVGGDQGFSFIGTSAFTGLAGQLRTGVEDGRATLSGDVDGDGVADFVILTNLTVLAAEVVL